MPSRDEHATPDVRGTAYEVIPSSDGSVVWSVEQLFDWLADPEIRNDSLYHLGVTITQEPKMQ